ncbi:MAG: hypothetical protein KIS77_02170 [Saprospiraceae bacterium]|nr:hypothetical protein [Saprospiraceae bacterium]
MAIHYLYARSFFQPQPDPQQGGAKPGREHSYYLSQAEKYWLKKRAVSGRNVGTRPTPSGRPDAALYVVASLRERAPRERGTRHVLASGLGLLLVPTASGTQALMVEVFDEVAQDRKAVEELRIWLLKNKQTNRWESTKAAEAVYALLLHGDGGCKHQTSTSLARWQNFETQRIRTRHRLFQTKLGRT